MTSANAESKPRPGPGSTWGKLLVVALFLAVAAFFLLRAPTDELRSDDPRGTGGAPPTAATEAPAVGSRCRLAVGKAPFRVGGEGSADAAPASADAGADGGDLQRFAPFAVVVGRGVRLPSGFAVGVRRDTSDGAVQQVALIDAGGAGRLVDLGRSRGDVGAPLIAAAGGDVVVGALEPNAGGFSIRLARISGDEVTWGDDLPQERDESLAYDLAVSGAATVVAWDEADRRGEHTGIVVAGVAAEGLRVGRAAGRVTSDELDAELPRLVPRADGFWLVYVARRKVALPPNPSDEDLQRDPEQGRYAAEMIEQSWLEAMPLEADGEPAGPARPVTPAAGHVQAFDVERAKGGAVLVAWRDDDTPTGADGGRVSVVLVESGGVGEPRVIAEEDVGLGAPNLLQGWVSLAAASGELRLAPLGGAELVQGVLAAEPSLGGGQLIASTGSSLLLAKPRGRAVDLVLAECEPTPVAPAPSPESGDGGS
ncbi:MAG: hypothetical protein JRI23_06715 [Deltaproteobacteria bacterium]|jgi:hypothetical protein|nr:hypothetical protein [Deltaproteobacteria bacterium]MBW2531279.1 hypothetical protein [Deltaproteobacteria bacterium]